MENYTSVVEHTDKVLALQPENIKALFRKGKVNPTFSVKMTSHNTVDITVHIKDSILASHRRNCN